MIKPPEGDLKNAEIYLKKYKDILEQRIKKLKVDAEIFVGGSFSKKTFIKKEDYDIDVFIRFDQKYTEKEISNIAGKIVNGLDNLSLVHGSRDYFKIKPSRNISIELIPVLKVKKPSEARNITDLSYSHVNYINKKIKSQAMLEEIILAKSFCYFNNCYGAESYIRGFSGYSLELLVYYYGSFLKMLKGLSKNMKGEKIIIDIEKNFKDKKEILMNLNSSKLESPVILIDPTYKQRNTLAALSKETFERFKSAARDFLKTPSINAFEIKKTDLQEIKSKAKKNGFEYILLEARTNKQEGDIAGSKLLKFYKHLEKEISRFFEVKGRGFDYDNKSSAKYYYAAKSRKDILITGPSVDDTEHSKEFKKIHKNYFIKNGRLYSKEKIKFNIKEFIDGLKKKNNLQIKEMYITGLRIIDFSPEHSLKGG